MNVPDTFRVDMSSYYGRDLVAEGLSRSLPMMRGKPVYEAVLSSYLAEVQEVYDAAVALMQARTVFSADGVWLEGVARIVGARKMPIDTGAAYPFMRGFVKGAELDFIEKTGSLDLAKSNFALAWVKNALLSETRSPSDSEFRQQVLARVYSNANRTSSPFYIAEVIHTIFGIRAKVETVGPMSTKIWVPEDAPTVYDYSIGYSFEDARYGRRWMLPIPATCEVEVGRGYVWTGSPTEVAVAQEGGDKVFVCETNGDAQYTFDAEDDGWAAVSEEIVYSEGGVTRTRYTVTFDPNETGDPRDGEFTLATSGDSVTFTFTQAD